MSYQGLADTYTQGVIDHAKRYVDGQVQTNGLENSWSLLKRTLKAPCVAVEPFHLFRYLDEQSFRSIIANSLMRPASRSPRHRCSAGARLLAA